MNKLILLLTLTVCLSGMSYASFKVEKPSTPTKVEVQSDVNKDIPAEEKTAEKDNTVALILSIVSVVFLPFGLHNWYLGRKKQALWQTLLVFPGIILLIPPLVSWVWQIVDMFKLLINGSL